MADEKLPLKKRIIKTAKKWIMVILNPRLLLCLLIAWMITNGWCYIMTGLGVLLKVDWMIWVGGAYMSLLWVPFTPEKIITVIIALFLMKLFFPNDEKTIGTLKTELAALKATFKNSLQKRREKRQLKKQQKQICEK